MLRGARPLLAALAILLAAPVAWAVKITIDTGGDPDSRLEIRTLTLPDGSEVQLYVLEGKGVTVTIDTAVLIADHVEFDLTNRVVRVVGYGRYDNGEETVAGDDLLIDLEAEAFQGNDVLVTTSALDVRGDSASRVPGQIEVLAGSFSPCSRCDQAVEDYGFRAGRLELYPGDRLVAYDVAVLLRGRELFRLPLLVVPLGPPDRQPRLSVQTGTAADRAEIDLSWPYVAGPDAFGSMTVRYYADVAPGTGSWFENNLLGGGVVTSYLGGQLDHRFYTDRGKGTFTVGYVPGFTEGGVHGRPQTTVRFDYATDETLGPPSLSLDVTRDDARRERLWEYTLSTSDVRDNLRGTYTSQGFVDLEPGDDVGSPSYAGRSTPLFTVSELRLEPVDLSSYQLGPFALQRALLDLGAFRDDSNPANRSAAATPTSTAGRVLDGYDLDLAPVTPWGGLVVSGSTSFTGRYYGTGERLIDWNSTLTASQGLAEAGSLSVTFTRNTSEGETPFVFDQIPLRSRTDVTASLLLDPLAWARLDVRGGYVFVDNRNPDALGVEPLDSTLTLFGDTPWIEFRLHNAYDIQDGDPGTIDAHLGLSSAGDLKARLQLDHVEDLAVTPDRLTGEPADDSHTRLQASLGVEGAIDLSVSGGYRYDPPTPDPGDPRAFWDPLAIDLTLGTLQQDDATPGLRLGYERNLNAGTLQSLSVRATTRAGPLELEAAEELSLPTGNVGSSTLRVAWPGIVAAEASGLAWIPPEWLGVTPDPAATWPFSVALQDAPLRGDPVWKVAYSTLYDPSLGAAGGYRNTGVTARALLTDTIVGPARFSVDFYGDLQLHDDAQPDAYLRRANLGFGVDLFERVGLQGTLGYSGVYSAGLGRVSSGLLTLQDVALMVRPLDELYVGAVFDDVWDLTGQGTAHPAFNLQPTFVVAWNRCCWALYGSWNSATGAIKVALTTPGTQQGISQVFQSALMLPERKQ